jgi:uncharacterized protein YjbI with pentapeptide repeats
LIRSFVNFISVKTSEKRTIYIKDKIKQQIETKKPVWMFKMSLSDIDSLNELFNGKTMFLYKTNITNTKFNNIVLNFVYEDLILYKCTFTACDIIFENNKLDKNNDNNILSLDMPERIINMSDPKKNGAVVGSNFYNCTMYGVYTVLKCCNFVNIKITKMTLFINVTDTNFTNVNMVRNGSLAFIGITDCVFTDCIFDKKNCMFENVTKCKFYNCKLSTKLYQNMHDSTFYDCKEI